MRVEISEARLRLPVHRTLHSRFLEAINQPPKSEIVLLQTWKEIPLWQQQLDTRFIETGYRPVPDSLSECLRSWLYLHNETVNIWSHLIGAVIFIALPLHVFGAEIPPRYLVATRADVVACSIYFIGVAICFLLSAMFHTTYHHSLETSRIGLQLDFQGVVILMWSATVPLIYYEFLCEPELQHMYWALSTILAALCSFFTFHPIFASPTLQVLRIAAFGGLGMATMIPVLHGVYRNGWESQLERMGLLWVILTLFLNTAGATAYIIKFPEKWFRRQFDIFGASHQLLHITVVLASLSHVMGILQAFDYLHSHGASCPA